MIFNCTIFLMVKKTRVPVLGCTFHNAAHIYLWLTLISSFASIIAYVLLHFEDFKRNTTSDNSNLLFCYMVVDLWTAITGLYSIEKKRSSLLIPFLIYKILDVAFLLAVFIFYYKIIMSSVLSTFEAALIDLFGVEDEVVVLEEASMMVFVIFLIIIGLKICFAFIVYKYHQAMKEQQLGRGRALVKLHPGPVCYILLK